MFWRSGVRRKLGRVLGENLSGKESPSGSGAERKAGHL